MEDQSYRSLSIPVNEKDVDQRLDVFLSRQREGLTRTRTQDLIREGHVRVNDVVSKPGYRLRKGDLIRLVFPPVKASRLEPEAVDFELLYEDASLLVLNKPPGLVVHPAPGHAGGTLVHGLLHHCGDLSEIGGETRPGIVHRLDKDTSGLLVVAKNDRVHLGLAEQFSRHAVTKKYLALVYGCPRENQGVIEGAIARHPQRRKEMAVVPEGGKPAVTLWRKCASFGDAFSLLSLAPKTGRTHQLRVHLAHAGYPILGDALYARRRERRRKQEALDPPGAGIKRQMLHAGTLGFLHPETLTYCEFTAPLPEDMKAALEDLEQRFPGRS